MPATARYGVFEIGMNHAGEITPLVAMVRPHIAIVTTVAPVHLEFFDSVDEIADAKAEIFSGVLPGGVAIINRDIATFDRLRAHAAASPARHMLSFGEHREADARLLAIMPLNEGSLIKAEILGRKLDFHLGAPGKHLAINALAVLLAVRACGVDPAVAAEALGHFSAGKGRGAQSRLPVEDGTFTLIDESYNANPASMRAALALLGAAVPASPGRRIAVLGEMRELGPQGAQLHADLARDVAENGVDVLFAAGALMRNLFEAVPRNRQGFWAERAEDIETALFEGIRSGDVIMVKGSNASRMGPLVAKLKERFSPATQDA
jgi:UDP-N-acetylmuramoyl-tripeptide--D-alanyl-D-alanine ligase